MQINGDGITFDSSELSVGTVFDTDFETGCIVTIAPKDSDAYKNRRSNGHQINFAALDSDRVECNFSTAMVKNIHGR